MVFHLPVSNEYKRAETSTNSGRLGRCKRYQFLAWRAKTVLVLRCTKSDCPKTPGNQCPNCNNSSQRTGPGRREKIQLRCCPRLIPSPLAGIAAQDVLAEPVFAKELTAPQGLCTELESRSRHPNSKITQHLPGGAERERMLRLLQGG